MSSKIQSSDHSPINARRFKSNKNIVGKNKIIWKGANTLFCFVLGWCESFFVFCYQDAEKSNIIYKFDKQLASQMWLSVKLYSDLKKTLEVNSSKIWRLGHISKIKFASIYVVDVKFFWLILQSVWLWMKALPEYFSMP
jgi:hypothetical protein